MRTTISGLPAVTLAALAMLGTAPSAEAATTVSVAVDTTSLIGHAAGPFSLVFSMTDGSGTGDGNSTVTVSSLDLGGGNLVGTPTLFGGASGDLKGGVVLTDTALLTFIIQQFTPGASLKFSLTVTATGEDGKIPDGVAFAILDNGGTPIPTAAPAGDFLTSLDLRADGPLNFYGSDSTRSPSAGGPLTVPVPTVTSNVPPTLLLPTGIVTEAVGPAGASVTYGASAVDLVDGTIAVRCLPASGSTFPLAATTVNCSASDTSGNTVTGRFLVTVQDTTPPTIAAMSDIDTEATSASGAIATFPSATSSDAVDGSGVAACVPASESTFPIGQTTVTCSARDAAGNSSSRTFTVTIRDTTPPVIATVDDVVAEATGPAGAVVIYASPATTDLVDGVGVATCSPASGNTLGLGTVVVECSARDAAGNQSSSSFHMTVRDTTPPRLQLPDAVIVEATGPSGAIVGFAASATDLVDGVRPVECIPSAGATFALGTTTVNCSSADAHNNKAVGSFSVSVRDTTRPVITAVVSDHETLWPPNKSMVPISLSVNARDAVTQSPSCRIATVSSNEPGAGQWVVNGPLRLMLQADRDGAGNGRIYTISTTCTDDAGNTSAPGVVTVTVPHDRGKE